MRWHRALASALALMSLSGVAHALDPQRTLAQLHHTAWQPKDGAPAGVEYLAQTRDGFLWLGTQNGLYRFDGMTFDNGITTSLPSSNISALYTDSDGSLWIGYRFGGASQLVDSKLTHYGIDQGLPGRTLGWFARDLDGSLWAATSAGLYRLDGAAWTPVSLTQAAQEFSLNAMAVEDDGTLWVTADEGVFFKRRGSDIFQRAQDGYVYHVHGTPAGVLLSDFNNGLARATADKPPVHFNIGLPGDSRETPVGTGMLLFDRHGTLWVSTLQGLFRVVWQERGRRKGYSGDGTPLAESFTRELGMSGTGVISMLEDREGNIWLGTTGGLDRFRPNKFISVPLPAQASEVAIAPDRSGSVLMTAGSAPSLRAAGDEYTLFGPSDIEISALSGEGPHWAASTRLYRIEGDEFHPLDSPPAPEHAWYQAVLRDNSERLWVSVSRGAGVFRQTPAGWEKLGAAQGLPDETAMSLWQDGSGAVWIGYIRNRIARIDASGARLFTSADGLQVGNVLTIRSQGRRVWIGGDQGIALLIAERFVSPQTEEALAFRGASGIVPTANGDVWINGAAGVAKISSDEVTRFAANPAASVRFTRYDHRDGISGVVEQIRPLPTAVQGADGRLWFTTLAGAFWIDPRKTAINEVMPNVEVLGIRLGNSPRQAKLDSLPVGTRQFDIEYTVPSLTDPERVRFRYRLEGVDEDWHEVGNRRVAYYTNVGPGDYRFVVNAANESGVWGVQPATLAITIPPRYFETTGFRAFVILAAAGLLWALYRLRLRHVGVRMRERLEARVAERERIARDLHDTLLQGFQALILRLEVVRRRTDDAQARVAIGDAVERAENLLVEGRDRVSALRVSSGAPLDLVESLQRLGAELFGGASPSFSMQTAGRPRPLDPAISDEVYLIAREALTNTHRHARADHVAVSLAFGEDELTVTIQDDGCGVSQTRPEAANPGHFGLAGMRERAAKIGSQLTIETPASGGTEVVLRVASRLAYARSAN